VTRAKGVPKGKQGIENVVTGTALEVPAVKVLYDTARDREAIRSAERSISISTRITGKLTFREDRLVSKHGSFTLCTTRGSGVDRSSPRL
jgi:hypothetical protein